MVIKERQIHHKHEVALVIFRCLLIKNCIGLCHKVIEFLQVISNGGLVKLKAVSQSGKLGEVTCGKEN